MKSLYSFCLLLAAPAMSAPATQLAATVTPDVLIIPFKSLSDPTNKPTLGRAVQQNLLADLGRAKLHPAQENNLDADPQSAARLAGAAYAISGTWQSVDDQLRFTGQITDAKTGAIVGGLYATGSSRDLFALEDALSSQAVPQLRQLETPPLPPAAIAAQPVPAPQVPPNPPINLHPYQGSELESYVYSNRTPSNDYNYQLQTAQNNLNYGYNSFASFPYCGYGYGYGSGYPLFTGYAYSYVPYGFGGFHGRHLPLR